VSTFTKSPSKKPTTSISPSTAPLSDIKPIEFTFNVTKSRSHRGFKLPLNGKAKDRSRHQYGTVVVPPNLLPSGWAIQILRVPEEDLHKQKSGTNECNGDNDNDQSSGEDVDVVSVPFQMIILDKKGRERSLQEVMNRYEGSARKKKELELQLLYEFNSKQARKDGKLQFGYLESGDDHWKLFENHQVDSKKDRRGVAKVKTDHLTSKLIYRIERISMNLFLFFLYSKVLLFCFIPMEAATATVIQKCCGFSA